MGRHGANQRKSGPEYLTDVRAVHAGQRTLYFSVVTASFGARPLIIDERSKQTARSRFPHLEIIKLNNNRKNVKSLD